MSYSVYLVKNRAGFFLDFEHPTLQGRWRRRFELIEFRNGVAGLRRNTVLASDGVTTN